MDPSFSQTHHCLPLDFRVGAFYAEDLLPVIAAWKFQMAKSFLKNRPERGGFLLSQGLRKMAILVILSKVPVKENCRDFCQFDRCLLPPVLKPVLKQAHASANKKGKICVKVLKMLLFQD